MEQEIKNMNDHDLLITMHQQIKSLTEEVKGIRDGTAKQIADHEARLRALEASSEDQATVKKVVYGAVGFILLSVLSALVYLVIKK